MDKLHYCSDANEKSINQKVGYQGVLKKVLGPPNYHS